MTPISFVVITGLSGAGKSYAIKCFEDMGFFCVDNLPTTLIPTFADLVARADAPKRGRVALGVDVREGAYLSHFLEALREVVLRLEAVGELRQLRDRDGLVADSLEVHRVVEDGEHEPEVGRDRRLLGEHLLDVLLDAVVARVDLVVEADHLVAELDVAPLQGVHRAAHRAEHDLALLLQARLESVEVGLELDAGHQPNRPVT